MEKIIWVVGGDRREMIEAQRRINSTGSMRAFCLLSYKALCDAADRQSVREHSRISTPSLIILDYEMSVQEDFRSLSFVKNQQSLAGVPLFFMVEQRSTELDEECYSRGATVILHKPFSDAGILRMERTAWQYDVTRKYEQLLQKQANDLKSAREILSLNQQLKARNDLLHQIFGRYFSDEVLEVILENPEGAAIGGEKRELTVMMADLRGFTSLSENLESDLVTELLNFYFDKMVEAITAHHGTVIEFLGDSVLAVFGAPLVLESQTEEAVAAAIAMQNSMGEVNAFCMERGLPGLEMGIGIHRGEVFIGNVGSERMMRYNVIGKTVNECSRIESYSVGGQVLISKEALEKISCPVEVPNQLNLTAKGIQKPMTVYEVTGIGGDYADSIQNVEFDIMHPVQDWILFNLFPIEGKRIQDVPLATRLCQCSRKRAVVELEEEVSDIDLALYTDVEIFAAGREGRAVFTGVYAKVVERRDRRFTLHFTHVNSGFGRFADRFCE